MSNVSMRTGDRPLSSKNERIYKFDNIRFILIMMVVFAHLAEYAVGQESYVYRLIYSFHMPAFLFLNGYFARFDLKKWFTELIIPYAVFQVIYYIFDALFISEGAVDFHKMLVRPYWLLWYLFVLIGYYLLSAMFNTDKKWLQIPIVLIMCGVALAAGKTEVLTYTFSGSRFFVYMPFFFAGFYIGKSSFIKKRLTCRQKYSIIVTLAAGIAAAASAYYFYLRNDITAQMEWGGYSYMAARYNMRIRLTLMIIACIWIFFIFAVIPCRRIPVISTIGRDSMSIYILHGFIVRIMRKYEVFSGSEFIYPILIGVSLAIVVILGCPAVSKAFRFIFTGKFFRRKA